MHVRHGFAVGAVINTKHPILKDLPDEGWGDWIFMPLLARAPRIFFDKKELPALDMTSFNPIVEMISEPSRVDKLATVFEAQVGKGRLLVSTCPADMNNPSKITLMDGLLRYAAGNDFKPDMKINPETLAELLYLRGTNAVAGTPVSGSSASVSKDKTSGCRKWYNKPTKIVFDAGGAYRIKGDAGGWKSCVDIEVSAVGVNEILSGGVYIKTADKYSKRFMLVGIDPNPPTIVLKSIPELGQEGGEYYAKPGTVFSLEADDDLSGVRKVEISLDGAEYVPYAGPFKLKEGTHSIKCRATDWAGNQEETMGGENLSGGPTRNAMIVVRGQ